MSLLYINIIWRDSSSDYTNHLWVTAKLKMESNYRVSYDMIQRLAGANIIGNMGIVNFFSIRYRVWFVKVYLLN